MSVRIGPDDVGRRVTVRARYHGPDATAVDAVGTLLAWNDGVLTIARRDGSSTTVAEHDLIAARVVSRTPARAGDVGGTDTARDDPGR